MGMESVTRANWLAGADVPASAVHRISRLIGRRPLWMPLPARLRNSFRAFRQRDLDRHVRVGGIALVALTLALATGNSWLLRNQLNPTDLEMWTLGASAMSFAVVAAVALMQVASVRLYYSRITALVSIFALSKLAIMPQLLESHTAAVAESYFCSLALIIISLSLRLCFSTVLTIVSSALMVSLILLLYLFRIDPDWTSLAYYFGATAVVCLFIAWLQEREQKVSFLQSVLLRQQAHERDQLNEELSRLALQDTLTGIANRREFDRTLEQEWARHRRDDQSLGIVFIDVDFFKLYNDHYGHGAGDDCLRSVATIIKSCLRRPADLVARYGGEEFVVLLPDVDATGARDVAQRIVLAIDSHRLPHVQSPLGQQLSVSIGVAVTVPGGGITAAELLEQADHALYCAKHRGRHQIALADDTPVTAD